MKKINALIILVLLVAGLAGCQRQVPGAETTPPPVSGTENPAGTTNPMPTGQNPSPVGTTAPGTSPTTAAPPVSPAASEEAIMIMNPGPGSRVTSPIRIEGLADPAPGDNLLVRVVSADGAELALQPLTIVTGVAPRGAFGVDLPVSLPAEGNIFIQVYTVRASDGGVAHLAATGVTFTPTGPAQINPRPPQAEQIVINLPQVGATLSGGMAHVEGFGLASFEQTLVVQVLDAAGNVVGGGPVTVQAPDVGQPGPFSIDVPYSVTAAGPGWIVVRDISPAFGGDTHYTSVAVTLQP